MNITIVLFVTAVILLTLGFMSIQLLYISAA